MHRPRQTPRGPRACGPAWALAWMTVLLAPVPGQVPGQIPEQVLAQAPAQPPAQRDNVLVILADDMGVERTPAYGLNLVANGPTPVIDLLARHGVLFRNAYAEPLCSPTRASILTGRHPFRTGIGRGVSWNASNGLHEPAPEEFTLPEALAPTHQTYAIGKWHLSHNPDVGGSGYQHPIQFGFDEHIGPISNLPGQTPTAYFTYTKNIADTTGNQQVDLLGRYATTEQVDDALAAIDRAGDEPWFVWLAFNAPHTPYHVPPADLRTLQVFNNSPKSLKHRAMIEAMDTEIGRLLTSIRPAVLKRTWIIFMGDNGTPSGSLPGISEAKGTEKELGIHVPLIVVGPDVALPGREVEALVGCTDLYATICDMARRRIPKRAVDSESFYEHLLDPFAVERRRTVFSETFLPNGIDVPRLEHRRALRSTMWKITRVDLPTDPSSTLGLFDLTADPLGDDDLLPSATPAQLTVFQQLLERLQELQ
jgi:arylsulfatase B